MKNIRYINKLIARLYIYSHVVIMLFEEHYIINEGKGQGGYVVAIQKINNN